MQDIDDKVVAILVLGILGGLTLWLLPGEASAVVLPIVTAIGALAMGKQRL
jgi:hypothetical protein